MSVNDSDACVPKALTDFVFDLYDSVTISQLTEEQNKLYNLSFRDLSGKYFSNTPWPSPQTIASECNGHPLFLALYRELVHRHWHAVSRITLRDRIEGWSVYRELFEEILQEQPNFYILPEWAFDILNEFVYQFQGFCQFRTALYSTAVKHGIIRDGEQIFSHPSESDAQVPQIISPSTHHSAHPNVIENLNTLITSNDVWDIEQVFQYLHRLVQIGTAPNQKVPAYQYLGIFASISLSRLECLLGDYTSSLQALKPILYTTEPSPADGANSTNGTNKSNNNHPIKVYKEDINPNGTFQTATDIIQNVFSARLSLAYHAGVSFLMLRRYKDAARILSDICSYMQRGFKTGQLRKLPNSDQFNKQYERMIALLAIVTHICPPQGGLTIDENILRVIREKHNSILSKIDSGEEGYDDLFMCPKFVTVSFGCGYDKDGGPTPADADSSATGGGNSNNNKTGGTMDNIYKLQIKQFMKEMECQHSCRKLRSYLKLYTSIAISKLAKFNDMDEKEDFLPLLLSYKHRMRQLEIPVDVTDDMATGTAAAAATATTAATQSKKDDTTGGSDNDLLDNSSYNSALDIHYYLINDMVHVDEAEKQRRFENYFVAQIHQNNDIIKDAQKINTSV